jgi:hypothetical protein
MSLTGNYRHSVRSGGRSMAPYSDKHITNASIYGYRPVVPAEVLREREERKLADNRSALEKWLGNPEPGRSALDQYRQREREREAAERIRPSISARISAQPVSKSQASSASGQKLGGLVTAPSGSRRDLINGHAIVEENRHDDTPLTAMQRKAYRLLAEGWSWTEVAFELAVPPAQLKRESRESDPRRRLEGHQKHGRRPARKRGAASGRPCG